jgi:hypothetical protein
VFIPARMADNCYLDSGYKAAFSHLPVWQQRQLVEGDWDTVPGAFFECWSSKNVIDPFEVPEHWLKFRALDWGFATPFSIGEFAVSRGEAVMNRSGEMIEYPEDCIIRVWEWYGGAKGFGNGNVGLRMDAEDVGRLLLVHRPDPVDYGVADESIWRVDSGPSVAEKFARSKVIWQRAERERVAGWQEMYKRIESGMFLCTSNCTAAIQAIPQVMADENKPEDVKKEGEDHVADEIRYGLMSRPWKKSTPAKSEPLVRPLTFADIMGGHRKIKSYERRI